MTFAIEVVEVSRDQNWELLLETISRLAMDWKIDLGVSKADSKPFYFLNFNTVFWD